MTVEVIELLDTPPTWAGVTWAERIENARKMGAFTFEDKFLARQWNTCAVGEAFLDYTAESSIEADRELNRRFGVSSGVPGRVEAKWYTIGLEFMSAVRLNAFDNAQTLLEIIHNRARLLRAFERPKKDG